MEQEKRAASNSDHFQASGTKYKVLARWARGGMADLYVAQQHTEGFTKVIALKVLRDEFSQDPEYHKMFVAEAQTASSLTHPGIVQTFNAGKIGQRAYIAMEFVNGETLGQVLRKRFKKQPMPTPLALTVTQEIAQALHYAHTYKTLDGKHVGLIHRDISPSNIMLTQHGSIKLIDFGIAKNLSQVSTTRAGTVKGKFAYMSPEQACGDPVDARSDVFSLGLCLWQMLTGHHPYPGPTERDVFRDAMLGKVATLESVGITLQPDIEKVLMKAIAPELDDRYQDARQFARALSGLRQQYDEDYDAAAEIEKILAEQFGERATKLSKLLLNANNEADWTGELKIPDTGIQELSASEISSLTRASAIQNMPTGHTIALDPGSAIIQGTGVTQKSRMMPAVIVGGIAILVGGYFVMSGNKGPVLHAERSINISSTSALATITLDGKDVGKVPFNGQVSTADSHLVSVQQWGYVPWQKSVPAGQESVSLSATLAKADLFGTLIVNTTPSGATVKVHGTVSAGVTPLVLDKLWVGESHSVIITKAGFEPYVSEVSFTEIGSKDVSIELKTTANSYLHALCSPSACEVLVNGVVIGKTPMQRMAIDAGTAKVQLKQGGKVVKDKTFSLEAGQLAEINYGEAPKAKVVSAAPKSRDKRPHRGSKTGNKSGTTASNIAKQQEIAKQQQDAIKQQQQIAKQKQQQDAVKQQQDAVKQQQDAIKQQQQIAKQKQQQDAIKRQQEIAKQQQIAVKVKVAKARIGSPKIDGIIDSSATRRAVKAAQGKITACHKASYAVTGFLGTVEVRFVVKGSGRVSGISASGSGPSALRSCIANAISSQKFPPATQSDAVIRTTIKLTAR